MPTVRRCPLLSGSTVYTIDPCRYIDLEKVVSVVEVEGEDPPDSEPEKFCFNIVCPERTYQLQTDSDDTRKQWVHYYFCCSIIIIHSRLLWFGIYIPT